MEPRLRVAQFDNTDASEEGQLRNLRLTKGVKMKEGMQKTLPALPLDPSGIWQGQDPDGQVSHYPLMAGKSKPHEQSHMEWMQERGFMSVFFAIAWEAANQLNLTPIHI